MGHTVAILGASGYAGGELLRFLEQHPAMDVVAASAATKAGGRVADTHPHLSGATTLELSGTTEALTSGADVVFSCLPSGQLRELIGDVDAALVVDLSDDFRAPEHASEWVYGLTEFARLQLSGATRIANPGCYPTASLLCLLPFARAGAISSPVVIDALSGVSGAGRKAEDRLLYSGLAANASPYGTTAHRHVPEIERALAALGETDLVVSFTPHLVPMARGVLATVRAPLTRSLSDSSARALLGEAFAGERFISVLEQWPQTKAVAGTNRAHLTARVDERANLLVCSAAIDNLGKGAAGQALQNANIALGVEEDLGLGALGVWP
jgi:N-acetyl-gamma-glutamyl-phosphate reductase